MGVKHLWKTDVQRGWTKLRHLEELEAVVSWELYVSVAAKHMFAPMWRMD